MTPADKTTLATAAELLPKLTPGPWVADGTGDVKLDDQEQTAIADCWGGDYEANAHLIAMSPDLARIAVDLARRVEVLEGVLQEVVECQSRNYGNGSRLHIEMITLSARARAALSATQPKDEA